jgi:LEA14-like dessication related protein
MAEDMWFVLPGKSRNRVDFAIGIRVERIK